MTKCNMCGDDYDVQNKNATSTICAACRSIKYRTKRQYDKVKELGTECCICHYNKCPYALCVVYSEKYGRDVVVCLNCRQELYIQRKIKQRYKTSNLSTQNMNFA